MSTYEFNNLMAGGLATERRGDNKKAARYFEAAAKIAAEPADEVRALHAAGVNWRVAGMTGNAMTCFNLAELRAREAGLFDLIDPIRLDRALVLIDRGEFGDAGAILEAIIRSGMSNESAYPSLGLAVAKAFMGRLELALGNTQGASDHFQCASYLMHDYLDRGRAAERDLLIWQMKVLSWPRRAFTGLRAIWLALATGYPRRAVEAVILAMPFGRGIYKWVRKHH